MTYPILSLDLPPLLHLLWHQFLNLCLRFLIALVSLERETNLLNYLFKIFPTIFKMEKSPINN